MIKVVVSDMDGTLFAKHRETLFDLSQRNEEALENWRKLKRKFYVASGRTILYGQRVLEKYGFEDVKVGGYNGAVYYDNGHIVYQHCCQKEDLVEIIHIVLQEFPTHLNVQLQTLDSQRVFLHPNQQQAQFYRKECQAIGLGRVSDDALDLALATKPLQGAKLSILFDDPQITLACQKRLQEQFVNRYFVTTSNPHLIEIGNLLGNKGIFIQTLCKQINITSDEIAVIGDGENDLEMFDYSDHCFAMASGNPEVIRRAKYVVEDVAECLQLCAKL